MTSERGARLRGLYAITPESSDTAQLVAAVEQCLAGGAAMVQYRSKHAAASLALEQARCLAAACRAHGALLIVNDSVELALAAGADGVHLGRDDAGVATARAAFPRGIIGVSCYDQPRLALEAHIAGADYVAIGSVFASTTKPNAARAALASLAQAKAICGLPVAAIGGIDTGNGAVAIAAGADMLAVITALFGARDVRAAAASFARLFEPARSAAHVRA